VCVCVFLSVCYYCSFSDCRIYLFSSLAARVFNKLTRYSLLVCLSVRLSVTRRYCVKTTAHSTVQFALLDSKMCLVDTIPACDGQTELP